MKNLDLVSKFVGIDELDELVYRFQKEICIIISNEVVGEFEIQSFNLIDQLLINDDIEYVDNQITDFGYCRLILNCHYNNYFVGQGNYSYLGVLLSDIEKKRLTEITEVFSMFLFSYLEKHEKNEESEGISIKASVSDLASIVAHEVKTPLQFMLSKIQVMKYKYENLDNLFKDDLFEIESEINRISKMVEELLEITKFSLNDERVVKHDANVVIDDIVKLMEKRLVKENITLNYYKNSSNIDVYASPVIIKQVVMNLVNNAIYALNNVENKKIELSIQEQYGSCVIIVKDNGEGIEEEHLPFVFKKGFSTKKSDGGSGLGLYAVKIFIKSIGGAIDVYSEKNIGTSFIIKVPLQ